MSATNSHTAKFDLLALTYSRLAMATLTPQNFEVAADGAFYDPQMYRLFMEFQEKVKSK